MVSTRGMVVRLMMNSQPLRDLLTLGRQSCRWLNTCSLQVTPDSASPDLDEAIHKRFDGGRHFGLTGRFFEIVMRKKVLDKPKKLHVLWLLDAQIIKKLDVGSIQLVAGQILMGQHLQQRGFSKSSYHSHGNISRLAADLGKMKGFLNFRQFGKDDAVFGLGGV